MWSIMAFILIGLVAGWAASLLVRGEMRPTDWGRLFLIGVAASLIAGIVINLILGYSGVTPSALVVLTAAFALAMGAVGSQTLAPPGAPAWSGDPEEQAGDGDRADHASGPQMERAAASSSEIS
jgi:uncharacterized membrane protein YeaQ/YmgE (transglycosylase-associated protein family)